MKIALSISLILLFGYFGFGQVTKPGLRNIEPDNAGETKVNQITNDAGIYFRQGLLNLQDNRRSQARIDFDKAVEVFLMSNVNVKSNGKLNNCYNQLIETIYRMEFPSLQQPQIKGLAVTCGWSIDNQLAETVVKLSQPMPKNTAIAANDANLINSVIGNGIQTDFQQVGFSDQKYKPSPLDELAKLELTSEENQLVQIPKSCQMPALQNIKPGSSVSDVEKIIGKKINLVPEKRFGSIDTRQAIFKNANTRSIVVRFYKNQVYEVGVLYENKVNWTNLYDFTRTISTTLKLPNDWYFTRNKAILRCLTFSLTAQFNKVYGLLVTDTNLQLKIVDEINKIKMQKVMEEEKKKAAFKP